MKNLIGKEVNLRRHSRSFRLNHVLSEPCFLSIYNKKVFIILLLYYATLVCDVMLIYTKLLRKIYKNTFIEHIELKKETLYLWTHRRACMEKFYVACL